MVGSIGSAGFHIRQDMVRDSLAYFAGRQRPSVLDIYKFKPKPVTEVSQAQAVLYAPMERRITSPLSQTIFNYSVLLDRPRSSL